MPPEKYAHINFKPNATMARNARRALDVRSKKPPSERGMTPVGLARARDLISRRDLSPDTVRRMKAYFDRHEVDKRGATWDEQGKGWQAWQGWGGDAGYAWARARVRQMEAADNAATEKSAMQPTSKAGRVISRRNLLRLRAIRNALQEILDDAKASLDDDTPVSKAYVLKRAADGRRYLGLISSNPYRDRDEDFVTEKALREAIDREWRGGKYIGKNVVLFWHDGPPIADDIFADVESRFLIEIAKERDTPFARAIFDMIEARPDIDWGVSIGFYSTPEDKERGIFRAIRREESSVLPRAFAANPYTHVEVKTMKTKTTKSGANARDLLRSMFLQTVAPEAAELEKKLRKGAKSTASQLEAASVQRKQRTLSTPTAKPAAKPVKKAQTPPPPPADETDEDEDEDTLDLNIVKMLDTEGLVEALTSMVTDLLGDQTPEDLSDRMMALVGEYTDEVDLGEMEDETEMESETDEEAADAVAEIVEGMDEEEKGNYRKQTQLLEQLLEDLDVIDELDKTLKGLSGLTGLPALITKLDKRIGRVEKALAGGPRAASQSTESEVDEDDDVLERFQEKQADARLTTLLPGLFNNSK